MPRAKPKDRLFEEPIATILDDQREKARGRGRRLVYDCWNNQVIPGDRVSCRRGHGLGQAKDGTISLLEVLKGLAPSACQKCEDYWTNENQKG